MNASPGDPDLAAMRRLQAGDDLALNEIMDRWQQKLTAYLFRAIGTEDTAVDLAQETFVRVYQARDKFRPMGKFSTWLFAIATNLLRQHFRWLKRHPTVSLDAVESDGDELPLSDLLPADEPDRVEQGERAKIVQDAVMALPLDLREAILLFEYEDLSHEQIAKIVGCSKKAVEMRIYRARGILREKLSRWLAD